MHVSNPQRMSDFFNSFSKTSCRESCVSSLIFLYSSRLYYIYPSSTRYIFFLVLFCGHHIIQFNGLLFKIYILSQIIMSILTLFLKMKEPSFCFIYSVYECSGLFLVPELFWHSHYTVFLENGCVICAMCRAYVCLHIADVLVYKCINIFLKITEWFLR